MEPISEADLCVAAVASEPAESICVRVLVDGPGYHESQRVTELLRTLDLSVCDCSPDQLWKLQALIIKIVDVFAMREAELGRCSLVQDTIDTGDNSPMKQQPHRTPMVQRQKIPQLISDMQKQGVVQPSSSAWASPVILVPKKDGSISASITGVLTQ